jgi:putative cell wall-binding protein
MIALMTLQPVSPALAASASVTITVSVRSTKQVTRIGGADRYEVSYGAAKEAFPQWKGIRHVVVASGVERAMADPLAASGLCGLYDAPLLLVRADWPGRLPAATSRAMAEIAAANPGVRIKIHVVGGPATVPASVLKLLGRVPGFDSAVDRIGGLDRYAVAAGIAARMRSVLGPSYPRRALFACGSSPAYFYDALAASTIAQRNHMPLLLVKPGSVPAVTRSAAQYYTSRMVIGSNAAVSPAVAWSLRASRIGGANRYEVAVNVADWAIDQGMLRVERVGISNRLADALTGGAAIGGLDGPLPLTDSGTLAPATAAWLAKHKATIKRVYIIGGEASVSPATLDAVKAILGIR